MKQKLFSILALLLMAATGAWAQTYTVTLKEGTEDADKWTISDGTKSANGATGFTGLNGGETVTITYTGTKRVKSVTAVKKAAGTTLNNTTTAWSAGAYAVPAGGLTNEPKEGGSRKPRRGREPLVIMEHKDTKTQSSSFRIALWASPEDHPRLSKA